jgi:hypothetical protein
MGTTDPVVVCTYGASGLGKSTDCGYSFPTALFVAAPGALGSIESTCGYSPKRTQVNTIPEATKLIEQVAGKFETVVIDDFSFLAEQTFSQFEKKYNGFKLWGELRDAALEFRDKARFAKMNVVLNAWEQPPKTKPDGTKLRGGPQLPGKLPESIPALCDIVLRVQQEPKRKPWPVVYRCHPDPSFVMKDRTNTATSCDPAPMNLAEILRASGIAISRHPEYKEQEDHVEAIAQSLTGEVISDGPLLNNIYAGLLKKGLAAHFAKWTLRDAVDRFVIRRAKEQAANQFVTVSNALGA